LKSLSIHCGLCHSDLSVLNNEWGISQYPAILGHEVVGRVTAVGPNAKKFSGKYSHRTIKGGIGTICLMKLRRPLPKLLSKSTLIDRCYGRANGNDV